MFTPIRPPVELMSATDIARLDTAWREIVSEMGVQFEHPEALAILAEAGQRVEGETVYFDADWVASKVAGAPSRPARGARTASTTPRRTRTTTSASAWLEGVSSPARRGTMS